MRTGLQAATASFGSTDRGCVIADLADRAAPAAIIATARARFDRVDGLVNVAGLTTRGSSRTATPDLFDQVFAVNARAGFFLMQGAIANIGKPAQLIDNLGAMRVCQTAAMRLRDARLVITFDDYTPESVEAAQLAARRWPPGAGDHRHCLEPGGGAGAPCAGCERGAAGAFPLAGAGDAGVPDDHHQPGAAHEKPCRLT